MGIKNFRLYAERFFETRCFKEYNVNQICYAVKDFSKHEVYDRALQILKEGDFTPTAGYDAAYERCGLYIDLASLQYGCLLKSLENNEEHRLRLASTADVSVVNDKTRKAVICTLEPDTIVQIANDCAEKLIETLKPLLTKAYRIYFAYDTGSPIAKSYEQAGRKRRAKNFYLSSATRIACYRQIVSNVRETVSRAHLENINELVQGLDRLSPASQEICRQAVRSAIAVQFPADTTPFGEGEWKCFYQMYEDIKENTVDRCIVYGRDWDIGFAMTMYQHPGAPDGIKYVYAPNDMLEHVKLFDAKERTLHFACLILIGNDYVGRLVNPSDENMRLLKTEFDKMYNDAVGTVTARQVNYLSATLFGDSEHMTTEEDNESPETKMKISVAFATLFARLLSVVYTARPEEIEDALLCSDNTSQTQLLRKHASLARTTVPEVTVQDETPLTVKKRRRTPASTKKAASTDGTAVLACKDVHGSTILRTFQQCMDSFATAVLWYFSYTRFYFYSRNGRETFNILKGQDEELPMPVGLCMGRARVFLYNDCRLSPCHRYNIQRLLDVKNILRGMEPCLFFWTLQNAFEHALESKR